MCTQYIEQQPSIKASWYIKLESKKGQLRMDQNSLIARDRVLTVDYTSLANKHVCYLKHISHIKVNNRQCIK